MLTNTVTTLISLSREDLSALIDDRLRAIVPTLLLPPEPKPEERLFTAPETMKLLHVSRPTLWAWERAGRLMPCRIGRRVLYRESDLIKAMQ